MGAHRGCERTFGLVQRDGGEAPAGTVACDGDAPRVDVKAGRLSRQPSEGGDGIFDRGRERVLGCEPVVEGEHDRAGILAQRAAQDVVSLNVAENAAAAMHKKDGRPA